MAALTAYVTASGVEVSVALPEDLHVVPAPGGVGGETAAADLLVRAIHPGLFDRAGEVLDGCLPQVAQARARYAVTVSMRRNGDALVWAICAGLHDGEYTASVLTLNAVEIPFDDPEVAVGGIASVLVQEGPADAEVVTLGLPAGPAVGRIRRRTLRAGADPAGDVHRVELGVVDVHLPVPGTTTLLVLEVVCPTVASFEMHAAMAGEVARSIGVVRRAEGAA